MPPFRSLREKMPRQGLAETRSATPRHLRPKDMKVGGAPGMNMVGTQIIGKFRYD
ncbi:hypothetical protein GCM10022281_24340 [Sphingomonas rosea]|uniref:Uncharacterized protein n=1 Tax=Sphingomonas rosea TaxID=335605 RepID=A0ABP7UHW0_9SPHN